MSYHDSIAGNASSFPAELEQDRWRRGGVLSFTTNMPHCCVSGIWGAHPKLLVVGGDDPYGGGDVWMLDVGRLQWSQVCEDEVPQCL